MEMMKDMVSEAAELRQQIAQEIDLISDGPLAGLYQFIHYFRLGVQVASNGKVMSSNGSHPEFLSHKDESGIEEEVNNSAVDKNEPGMSSREITLSLAGAWSDMPDEEFDGFLNDVYARRRGEHLDALKL